MNFHDAKGILCNAEETGDTFKLGLLHYEMELDGALAKDVAFELMSYGTDGRYFRALGNARQALSAAKQDPHGGKVILSIEDAESLLGERQ